MPKPDITAEWRQQLQQVDISKEEMNRLVMHYLLVEGYKDAAEEFAKETGLHPGTELEAIQDRMLIRQAVEKGQIEEAIDRINELEPELLDERPDLYFKLQQQRLIEFLRENKLPEALQFAQDELALRGEENPALLEELERTMALFAFENVAASPLARLMEDAHRHQTAGQLNAAMLTAQSMPQNPKLPMLLRTLFWTQHQLDGTVTYPRLTDILDASPFAATTDNNSGAGTVPPTSSNSNAEGRVATPAPSVASTIGLMDTTVA